MRRVKPFCFLMLLVVTCFNFQSLAKSESHINTGDAKELTLESFQMIRKNVPRSENFIKDSDFEKAISKYFNDIGSVLYKYESNHSFNKMSWVSSTEDRGSFELNLVEPVFSFRIDNFSDESWVEKLIFWLPNQDNTYGLKFKMDEISATEAQTYLGKKYRKVIYYKLEISPGKEYFGFWDLKRKNGHVKTIYFLPARPVAIELDGKVYNVSKL
ncbi:hypothetical protein [Vibrio parahaemolyticus]|uniref:hypothetical protein n=1 Tax=Vibrio parahaemolyticus TaxID=670 RepID=UPI0003F7D208|nr:hypothetical protein [Vibrio parahaemolyticus]EJB5289148.1 hypothetical protein [Vibrio parahaemolyticus]ELU8564057.1 hypothetical protein [Vibrio parahaemolyticus]MCC3787667.1 hypothetical protein [Vibrio parahaemolyticus]MCC3839738.1 hypothetical protein [Vibrio parahaemolyticus]